MIQPRYRCLLTHTTPTVPLPDDISRHRQSFDATLAQARVSAAKILAKVDRAIHPDALVTIYETVEREVGKVGWVEMDTVLGTPLTGLPK